MKKSELTSMFASSQIYTGTRFTLETIAWFTQERAQCSAETAENRQERLTKHKKRDQAGIVKLIFSRGTQLLKIWLPPLIDHMGIFLRDNNLVTVEDSCFSQ